MVSLGAIPLLVLGCSESEAPPPSAPDEPVFDALALPEDWAAATPKDDPLVDDPERVPACQSGAFWSEPELGWLEIDSGACSWVTLHARARRGLAKGQQLLIEVSHFDLVASAPAEATLKLALADCPAWSKRIAIPSEAAVYSEQLRSPCAVNEGDSIWFHVDNHGQNAYQLRALMAER